MIEYDDMNSNPRPHKTLNGFKIIFWLNTHFHSVNTIENDYDSQLNVLKSKQRKVQ